MSSGTKSGMKALVVYDSVHGNTERIARAVAAALGSAGVRAVRPREVSAADVRALDLLLVGSPTLGGRPTSAIEQFLAGIPAGSLGGTRVAAFDTRMEMFVARLFPRAAARIAEELVGRGGSLAASPEGFVVRGRNGPLKSGEEERATAWAAGLAQAKG